MREFSVVATLLAATTLLAGCGAIELADRKAGFSVQAVPLDACLVAAVQAKQLGAAQTRVDQMVLETPATVTQACPTSAPETSPTPDQMRDLISLVVFDSERKCNDFVTGLVLHETATNSALDMTTTFLTALGTAFTPLATVHALTAAGSVSSGWKTAIDSDIFAQATIANYAQAIQATYYTKMSDYINKLGTQSSGPGSTEVAGSGGAQAVVANAAPAPAPLNVAIETTKIQTIHATCGLAPAQSTITATLQSKATATSGTDKTIVTFAGTVSAADSLLITFTSATVTTPPSATVAFSKTDTPATIMLAVLAKVTEQITSKVSGLMVSPSGSTTLIFQSPAADKVTWKITPQQNANKGLSIVETSVPAAASGATAATVPGAAAGQ